MYAVVFDLDTNCLMSAMKGETYHGAYRKVRDFMSENGFSWTQGSVYFGNETVDAVKMRVGHSENGTNLPWFQPAFGTSACSESKKTTTCSRQSNF